MKKIISLVAVFAIIATCSFGAFAADFDVSEARVIEGVEGVYTVEADSNADYATIVAVKGTTIQVGAIQYINQAATENNKATFTFALNDVLIDAAIAAGNTDPFVYVLTGGDGQKTVKGYIDTTPATEPPVDPEPGDPDEPGVDPEPDEPEVTYFTISGKVTGYAGTTPPVVKVTDGEKEQFAVVDADGVFTATVAEGATYTLTATKLGYLSYTKSNIAAEISNIAAGIKFGDIDANGEVGIDDVGGTILKYKASSAVAESGYEIVYDADENGEIGIDDVGTIILNYKSQAISE